jgi:hypothetical protein
MTKRKGRVSVASLLTAIKPIKTRLAVITATMIGDGDLPQEMLDASYDHHERLRATQIVLSCLANTKDARINEAAIDALRKVVEEAQDFLDQPEVAIVCPMMQESA